MSICLAALEELQRVVTGYRPHPCKMAAESVVEITDEAMAAFNALKLKRKHRFVVFKIEE